MVRSLKYRSLIIILLLALLLLYYPRQGLAQSNLVPVANASIQLVYQDGSTLYLSTDANGVANALVRPGTYSYISVSGATIKTVELHNINIDNNNNVVNVTAERCQWILGNITSGGSPVEGVQVVGPNMVMSDADGRFALPLDGETSPRLSYMPNDPQSIRYMSMYANLSGTSIIGYISFPKEWKMVPIIPRATPSVVYMQEQMNMGQYAGQEKVHHDVQMSRSLILSGTVTDTFGTPIQNALILVSPSSGMGMTAYAITDANGNYEIRINLMNGNYVINAVAEGFGYFNSSLTISGNTVFNIQLQQAAVIKGHIVDGNNQPLKDIQVWAVSNSGWMAYTVTDANGYYEFGSGFKVGDNVTIYYGDKNFIRYFGMYAYSMQQVILNSNVNVFDLVYDVPSITISGTVDDVDREGLLETVMVSIKLNPDVPYPMPGLNVSVNKDGTFSIKIPTRISLGQFTINIVSVDVSVWSEYYYPNTPVGTGISTTQDINLGTIQISSYPLIQATFYVYTTRSSLSLPVFHHRLNIQYEDLSFPMTIETNSSLSSFIMGIITPSNGSIILGVMGPPGTKGYLRITIPKAFMAPPYNLYIDNELANYNVVMENATHVTLEINYGHSEHSITISSTSVISEFPLNIYTMIIMAIAVIAISIYFRRLL